MTQPEEIKVLWAEKQSYKLRLDLYQNRCKTLTSFVEGEFGCTLDGINNDVLHGYLESKV